MKTGYLIGGLVAGGGLFLYAVSKAGAQTTSCDGCCVTEITDSLLCCCQNGVFCMGCGKNQGALVAAVAQGIAVGEGFNGALPDGSYHSVTPPSKGTRYNNPGDIMHNGQMVLYGSPQEGWNNLYALLNRIFTGGHPSYRQSETMITFAATYTADKPNSVELSSWFSAVQSACHKAGFRCESDMTLSDFWNQTAGMACTCGCCALPDATGC